MAEILSSWKEIATYFGKGVRTVQRWERIAGLPIHRPKQFVIMAHPTELEAWLRKNDMVTKLDSVESEDEKRSVDENRKSL